MTTKTPSFSTSHVHEDASPRQDPSRQDSARHLPPRARCRRLGISVLLTLLTMAGPTWAATITVDSAADNETSGDGLCTLREALNNANGDGQTTGGDCTAGSGTDTIEFDISGSSPIEIELTATLIVTDAVVIDGTTQPGNTGACTTSIPDRPDYGLSLLGDGVTGSGPNTAFRLQADGSTLRGLNFRGFDFTTIILTADNNLIECNFIGSTADGSSLGSTFDSGSWGVSFQSAASDNTVRDNLISGKGVGIRFGGNSTGNQIQRNFVGTDRAGTAAIANDIGVFINGDNELGTPGNGNLISGNSTVGVRISGGSTVVYDNLIGTDVDGTSALPNGLGIEIDGDGNVVGSDASGRRNVISGNTGVGVEINGADNELAANYIGVDITGTTAVPNGSHGVTVAGSGTFIKTLNVISGNLGDGVNISDSDADTTRLWTNRIGTNAQVTAAVPNGGNGVTVSITADNELTNLNIGNTRGLGNVISGNTGHGVYVEDSDGSADTRVAILGNRIGTNGADDLDLGNGLDGIRLVNRVRGTIVGQFQSDGPTFTNTIAFNGGNGVTVTGSANDVSIAQNYIFENDGLGIDLANDGVTDNDSGDGDGGPNRRQNFPDLQSASIDCAGDLNIEFFLDSSLAPSNTHFIEFFLADADGEEGAFFIGNQNYMSAVSATANLGASADLGVEFGDLVIATAKSHLGDTSEFSASIAVGTTCAFGVTNTDDSGAGSLRQAILDANAQSGTTRITFDIAGSGPHVISPLTALPAVTGPTTIDGASQPGNESICTTALASRPDYQIVIDGTAGGRPDLLTLASGSEGSTVQGLNLRNGNRAIVAQGGEYSILCNLIGTDESGSTAAGNNVGIAIASDDNEVGGLLTGEENAIAFNGVGVVPSSGTANTLRGNSFFENSGLAIDLGGNGSTANDAGDGDTGANLLQNSPELGRGLVVDTEVQITYTVDSDPLEQAYPITVDFFVPDTGGDEGRTWLFSDTFESGDYPGDVVVTVTASTYGLEAGDELIALATDADGNTSEFSASVELEGSSCLDVTTTADSGTGSLREAITCANATSELDTIRFAIPGTGPHVIDVTSSLPTISAPVFIDGTTQSGNGTVCASSIPDRPTYQVIINDGASVGTGFFLGSGSDGSTIRGLNIRGFGSHLIEIDASSAHTIACNFLGTDETGAAQSGSSGEGVGANGGSSITIGGYDATQGNLVATRTSSHGIFLSGGGSNNSIRHNFIGTDKAGTTALPNDFGVVVSSTGGAQQNLAVLDNLISGNNQVGI
ncbi:MAG: hypothetical protein AAGD06_08925, partial [Acidobacteriota bacterium]